MKRKRCEQCAPYGCLTCFVCGATHAEVHASYTNVRTGEIVTNALCTGCLIEVEQAGQRTLAAVKLRKLARETPVSPVDYLNPKDN